MVFLQITAQYYSFSNALKSIFVKLDLVFVN
jgi:hypothetical protein